MKIIWMLAVLSLVPIRALALDDVGDFVGVDDVADDGNSDSDTQVPLIMLDPLYSGTGCPDGTASFALTEDRKTLSMLFDQFIAQAGKSVGKRRDQKECLIRIPFKVPPGYQAAVTRVDFRGFYSLPQAGRAMLLSSFIFHREGMPSRDRVVRQKTFAGPLDSDYAVSAKVSSRTVLSECGQDFELRINAHILTMSNAQMDDSLATVDSVDALSHSVPALPQLRYHLRWKKCMGDYSAVGGSIGPRGPNYHPTPRPWY